MTNLPLVNELPAISQQAISPLDRQAFAEAPLPAGQSFKLSDRRRSGSSNVRRGFWAGSRDGIISSFLTIAAALVFGGGAGAWFAPEGNSLFQQLLTLSIGTMTMSGAVALVGTLLTGKNPIFWGVGMPLLTYAAGAACAFISGHAGSGLFFLGAPLFCGLAILSGILTAFVLDRES